MKKRLATLLKENETKAAELALSKNMHTFQSGVKETKARKVVTSNALREKIEAKLIYANRELVFQNKEKEKRVAELIIEPEVGKDLWCGSFKIYDIEGNDLPLDKCPMARAMNEGRVITGEEIIVERPNGTQVLLL